MTTRLTKKNLSDQVAALIGQRIARDEYRDTGTLPSEEVLRTEFAVSRTAIREAIKMLASKGIVESRPRTGIRILPKEQWNFLDADLLNWSVNAAPENIARDFLCLRRAIEPNACAAAATYATEVQKSQLQIAFRAMEDVDKNWSHEKWVPADSAFHKIIYQASGNIFYVSFGRLMEQAFQKSIEIASSDQSTCLGQHRKLMQAILNGDADLARDCCIALLAGDKLGKAKVYEPLP